MKKYLIILLSSLLMGCSDFLEPKSQSEYVPENVVALNEMLLGTAYPQPAGSTDIMAILLLLDDDICCTDSLGGSIGINDSRAFAATQAIFGWQPNFWQLVKQEDESYLVNYWENYYQYILGANAALDYVDEVSGEQNEKNLVKAQSYALRAYYYFQLVNFFGKPYNYDKKALGVPLKLNSALEDKDLPRNTVEEVYDQIINDLTEAEKLYESLPIELQFKKDYRTNLPMVQLLKSRVYLYMEDWENSMTYAQKVIDNSNFSLIDLKSLPEKTEQSPYYNFISMDNSTECIWTFGSIHEYLKYAELLLTVLEDPQNPLGDSRYSYNFFNASSELLDSYSEGDLRKENYILKGRSREKVGENEYQYRPDGYYCYGKFSITSDLSPNSGSDFAYAFRLAEAYLNLSEAAAKLGEDEIALNALNTLRENRFSADKYKKVENMTGDDLVERIRLERRLELCYEGHRWFDLRRYGMPAISHVWKIDGQILQSYTLQEKDAGYTLPIPQDVLDKNTNLEQNELPTGR